MDEFTHVYVVTARDAEYKDDVSVIGVFWTMQAAIDAIAEYKFDAFANVESLTPREFLRHAARGEKVEPNVMWVLDKSGHDYIRSGLVQPLTGVASFKPIWESMTGDTVDFGLSDDEYGMNLADSWMAPDIEVRRVDVGKIDYWFPNMPRHDDEREPDPVEVKASEFSFATDQHTAVTQRLIEHINKNLRDLERVLGRKITEKEAHDYAEGMFHVLWKKVDEKMLSDLELGKAWGLHDDERIGNGSDDE